jgi:23S rRNA (pseudouridine1915-N3)-methyltransferase
MNILIVSPGKKHEPALAELIAEYEKRLAGRFGVEWRFVAPDSLEKEGAAILKAIDKKDFVILLDEKGKPADSNGFAALLERASVSGKKRIAFVIGGAYGVTGDIKNRADAAVSLSQMTFPHRLVRLILAEQIYRASEIMRGGKYHHGG